MRAAHGDGLYLSLPAVRSGLVAGIAPGGNRFWLVNSLAPARDTEIRKKCVSQGLTTKETDLLSFQLNPLAAPVSRTCTPGAGRPSARKGSLSWRAFLETRTGGAAYCSWTAMAG